MTRALWMTTVYVSLLGCASSPPAAVAAPEVTSLPPLAAPAPTAPPPLSATASTPTRVKEEPPVAPEPPESFVPPRRTCEGFVSLVRNGKTVRLTSGCHSWRPVDGPYAEVLDPSGDTRLVVEACSDAERLDVLGYTKKLPGPLARARVRTGAAGSSDETISKAAHMEVTSFGAVGDKIEGTFRATMTARLNERAETVSGRFRVCRGPDRGPP